MKKSIFLFFAAILCAMTANAAKERVYFVNTPGWAKVNVHAWGGTAAGTNWPGTTATKDTWQWNGKDVYYLEAEAGAYGQCIFNNGSGQQSADLTWTANSVYAHEAGKWTPVEIAKATTNGTKVYFVNTEKWTTVKVYAFSYSPKDTKNATWPGANATKESDKVGEYDVYSFTMNKEYDYCIFNNGASSNTKKTADLVVMKGADKYYCKDDWYTKEEAIAKLVAPIEYETVYFVNAADWTGTIRAYAYTPVENATWPGEPAEKEDYQIGGKNVYSYTAEKGKYKNVIFNGTGGQTADLIWTADKYYCKDGWYTKEEAEAKLAAPVVDVYTVVGSEVLLGTDWDLNNANNEMTKQDDGSYILVKENVDLAKTGTYEYKVVKNHDWGWSVPSGSANNTLKLGNEDVDGTYNVTFTLNKELNALTYSLELVEAKKVIPECYVAGDESLTGQNWNAKSVLMTYDEATEVYTATLTAVPAGTHNMKVVYGGEWLGFDHLATPAPANVKEGDDKKIQFTLAEAGDVTVTYHATNGIGLTGNFAVPETKYYIAGTENLTGFDWKENGLEMTKEGDVYKHTFSEKAAGTYEFKITNGTWTDPWGYNNLGAAYEEVSQGKDEHGNDNGNIKFVTEEAKNITVIFDPATGKITIDGLTEKAPAADVTVYFINSGNWAEVACYYWGGIESSTWPGAQMTANGEVYEAEGWEVYAITFPGDNTQCIFNDNKAEGTTKTADLEVQNGKYYCYENGIWYERLADVDPLDTRVYLKGEMNEWCANYCDMFRKETVDGTVAYRTLYLEEAETTYEFKIEDAGAWLSNTGTMTKDNCTDWTFEESVSDNAKFTTEYAGEYTFVWDMTTKKLSVVYPELVPEVMELMVTDMVFDGATTFSGTDNMMGIEFSLVAGNMIEDGVFELAATSTVNFGGTLFTDVTGMIAPDMDSFASASAVVYGFYMGMYFQLNVEMSAGGSAGVPVEILDGTASVNGAGELTISGNWDGDDVYVVAPGFNGVTYDCDEVWFYVGGTTWETASIIAFGPATITVEGNDVSVEGTLMSGMTGTQYELLVIGTLPVEETPDYTRTVTSGSYGTICLPNGSSKVEGAKFYEVTYKKDGYIYADEVTELAAGMPYIFQATSTEIKVYYNETTATAGSKNGVYGTFSDITDGDAGTTGNVLEGNYLLVTGPKVQKCAGNCSLAANRAYFVVSEISVVEQQSAPGRKRIALGCQEENQATGLDNITENGIVAPAMQGTYDILGRQLSEPAANGFYIINGKKMFVVK
jgi:hypothetical protein